MMFNFMVKPDLMHHIMATYKPGTVWQDKGNKGKALTCLKTIGWHYKLKVDFSV